MRKRGLKRSAAMMMLILAMLASACSGNNTNNAPNTGTTETPGTENTGAETPQELTTLRVLVVEPGTKWNTYPDSAIAQEIARKVGVKIEYVEADDNKFNVMLAGGDLPDIVRADPNKYAKQLIDGNLIIPMDDLLAEHGGDITANVPGVIEYGKQNWSAGQGKVFFLPPQVQAKPSPVAKTMTIGPTIRWEYYKEIGTPEIKNSDDLLNVLEQIVEKHPTTEDGKKIYGVSMWQDWGLWPYNIPFVFDTQQLAANTDIMVKEEGADNYINFLTNETSSFWKAMDFYNQAHLRGLLDPDALTMKHNDYLAKATAGQFVVGPATWAMGDFNSQNAKDGNGYVVIPAGKLLWSGGVGPLGWADKSYAISKSSKNPEKAMEFLNYLYSYEGARSMYSGIEGEHWEMVDGKPVLKDETFALKTEGGAAWESTGIALDRNLIGLGSSAEDPATGTPVDLFTTVDALAKNVTALEKDFSEHFGASYPGEVVQKLVEAGTYNDFSTPYQGLSDDEIVARATIVTPILDEELTKIEAQLKELGARHAARIILSKNEAEFEKNKQDAIKAFTDAGAEKITEYYTAAYTAAKEAAGVK
ncbi:extracellular solute-binding protein [Paenibacillus daejeonensis]|uniref:extracellular solute-binding protein n=1 Tax=Paenibacillus daejeonensis TaxID=135193 RepID=UPI00036CD26D|nr:extracellular solute-binding protein [Paenibacillus daejeonensis]